VGRLLYLVPGCNSLGVGIMRQIFFLISEILWTLAYTFRSWSKTSYLCLLLLLPGASFSADMGEVNFFISTYCPSGWYPMDGTAAAVYSPDPFYTMLSGVSTYTGSQVTCHSDGTWHCHVPDVQGLFFRAAADGQGPFIGYNNSPSSSRLAYTSTQSFSLQGHFHRFGQRGGSFASWGTSMGVEINGNSPNAVYQVLPTVTNGGVWEVHRSTTWGSVQISSETRPANISFIACVATTTSNSLLSTTSNYYVQYSSEVVSVTLTDQDLKDFQNFLFVIFFFWLVISAWKIAR